MVDVTERSSQLEDLKKYLTSKVFVDPIYSNERFHPRFRTLIGIYFQPLEESTGTIINLLHPDGLKLKFSEVFNTLNEFKEIFTLNKKDLLYTLPLLKLIDINLIYTFEHFQRLVLPDDPSTIRWLHRYHRDHRDMNLFIPLTKLHQRSSSVFENVKKSIKEFEDSPEFQFYNTDAVNTLFLIEKEGVKVDTDKLVQIYKIETPELNIHKGKAYTYFNMYNNTTRPTNSFNHINFSAIPHKPEYRENFLPTNDKFIEFDFDGYHLRLLGDLFGYTFTRESAHLQLGKEYFNKQQLTDQEYSTTKQINFSSIYGNPPEEFKHTPFISKLETYTNKLWKEYTETGFITDVISGRKFNTKLNEMYPKKLLNYSIQSLETSNNIRTLKQILKLLRDKTSKVVMYTYDAFLIDFSTSDGLTLIQDITQIMEQDNKFPIGTKESKTLVL